METDCECERMYINWNVEMHFHIEYIEFVYLADFMRALLTARHIVFSDQAEREETRKEFINMVRFKINKTTRAPNQPFVNLTNGIFSNYFNKIILALDFNDTSQLVHNRLASDSDSKLTSYYDAKCAFKESIKEAFKTVATNLVQLQLYGIFTQNTFEHHRYSLKWRNYES